MAVKLNEIVQSALVRLADKRHKTDGNNNQAPDKVLKTHKRRTTRSDKRTPRSEASVGVKVDFGFDKSRDEPKKKEKDFSLRRCERDAPRQTQLSQTAIRLVKAKVEEEKLD